MKNNIGVVVGVVVAVLIVVGFFININSSKVVEVKEKITTEDTMTSGDTSTAQNEVGVLDSETVVKEDTTSVVTGENVMVDTSGSYEAYSTEKIARATSGDVVLFFRAGWCPTCRTADADIKTNIKNIPTDLTILDVDYDNSSELKKKYGVTYQHTFVQVDAEGKLIKKWSGSPTLSALVAEIK